VTIPTHFRGTISASCAVLCLGVLLCGCTPSESQQKESLLQHCDYNPSHFLLTQLATHRAVLLGDSGHGMALYMQTVISFLTYWLDEVEKDKGKSGDIPRNIYLMIERDSADIQNMRKYWESNDINDLYGDGGFFTYQVTTASLEYYFDLRAFSKRVSSHNAIADSAHRVGFDIVGPEMVIDLDNWSLAKRDSYFIYKRDEYSSDQILKLLSQHPDWKAFLYFGNAHINKKRALKTTDSLSDSGYFLAHYLTDGLEDYGGLYVVGQSTISGLSQRAPIWGEPFYSYGADVEQINCPSVTEELRLARIDGLIALRAGWPQETMVSQVPSANLVRAIGSKLDKWTSSGNQFYRSNLNGAIAYLQTVSGSEIDTLAVRTQETFIASVPKWKQWCSQVRLDVVSDIEHGTVVDRLIGYMAQSSGRWTNWYENEIAGILGREPEFDTSSTSAERAAVYTEILQKEYRPIMIDHLVNLLWVGTPEECAKALVILKRETGQNLETAKEWMVWYRQNRDDIWNRQP
jgi:hypothetical protein